MALRTTPVVFSSAASAAALPTVVYVASADSREIHVGHLDRTTGAVTVIQRTKVPGAVMPLAVSPNQTLLYASLRSEPFSAAVLSIDPTTGRLRLLSITPLPNNMSYLSTDRTGRFLFGASFSGDKMSVNRINREGRVEVWPVQIVPTAPNPHSVVIHPSNRYLFVPCLGGDMILQYRFDPTTGRVTPNAPPAVSTKKKAGPRHLVVHPNRRFVYTTNELDATVGGYRFDVTTGTLTPIGTKSILPPDFAGRSPYAAADIHVTPDGRHLYASERASNSLAGFKVDAKTGVLTSAGNVPTEEMPRGFNIDPQGHYLLAVGQVSNSMTSYAINTGTGALSPRYRYPMGKNPNWVEIIDLP